MSHQIRIGSEADLENIMQIEKACFGNDAWSKSNMKSEILAPHTTYVVACLLYTSPSPRDGLLSRMPSSA